MMSVRIVATVCVLFAATFMVPGCAATSSTSSTSSGATTGRTPAPGSGTGAATSGTGTAGTGTAGTGTAGTGTAGTGTAPGGTAASVEQPGSYSHATDSEFCSTHQCIESFSEGNGYVVQCMDGEWSHSGGLSGACSDHGGES